MKTYKKLTLPSDSAWDRRTWRRYAPIWLKQFIDGLSNIIRWIPVIYKDKDWDDYYITKILQKKIEHQRAHLVKENRHTRIDEDNFWMTVVLNLIEREHEEFYGLEKYEYIKSNIEFVEAEDYPGSYTIKETVETDELDKYLAKYPASVRKVKKLHPDKDFSNQNTLAFYVGQYNQERCRYLLFEILKRYSNRWWD